MIDRLRLRLALLRWHLHWAERSVDRPWTASASVRLDRLLIAMENMET